MWKSQKLQKKRMKIYIRQLLEYRTISPCARKCRTPSITLDELLIWAQQRDFSLPDKVCRINSPEIWITTDSFKCYLLMIRAVTLHIHAYMRARRYASSVELCTKYAAYAKAAYASFAYKYHHLHICTIPSHICTTYSHISDESNAFAARVA